MPSRRHRHRDERDTRQLRSRPTRSRNTINRQPNVDLVLLRHSIDGLNERLSSANREIASLQRANRQLRRETHGLRRDLNLDHIQPSSGGFPIMKLPPELRVMIWHFAAETDRRAVFEVIQPVIEIRWMSCATWVDVPYRFRFQPGLRTVAQACREARATLHRSPDCQFSTPTWTWMNGGRDYLMIPFNFILPRSLQLSDFLGHSQHITLTRFSYQFYPSLFVPASIVVSILKAAASNRITIQSMSFICGYLRVSSSIQTRLESVFKSHFPLVINIDNESDVSRVDRALELDVDVSQSFSNWITSFRDWGRSGPYLDTWEYFREGLRLCGLENGEWPHKRRAAESRLLTRDPSEYQEASNRLPEFRRVVVLYPHWEAPADALIFGPKA
ncbi:hypothetical protein NUW58_g6446 [Xylaria curta]|uniref:Uncharacterized protein n=1 Tax=Xylaria curta TaxID=42375 RepID=A0ACC1NVA2_9PEZI|nr:hypothetical protein NUW58_g6446 [Xylaria curta]